MRRQKFLRRLVYVLLLPYIKLGLDSDRAYVLLIDKQAHEVFFVKKLIDWDDSWFLPGGGLEEGEDHLKAACREIEEEVGLKLDSAKLAEFCVLPGKNRLRPGRRVIYAYLLKKRILSYDRRELRDAAWLPINSEIRIDRHLSPVLDKLLTDYGRH